MISRRGSVSVSVSSTTSPLGNTSVTTTGSPLGSIPSSVNNSSCLGATVANLFSTIRSSRLGQTCNDLRSSRSLGLGTGVRGVTSSPKC
nr:hypothetical protein [uncultured bacterium]